MEPIMDDKERIEFIIKQQGLTNVEFAAKAGIAPATLSHITSGRSKPTLTILRGVISGFPELNPEWILMGTGSMYKEISKPTIEDTPSDADFLSNGETDLFSSFDMQSSAKSKSEGLQRTVAHHVPSMEEVVRTTVAAMTTASKHAPRRVTEIRIFFDDGTYQQFN